MAFTPIASIAVRSRQRTLDGEVIAQLEASIPTKGLIHAILIGHDDAGAFLVAGEHRLNACKNLHEKTVPFFYNREAVPVGCIPTTDILDLSPADLLEVELEENIIRAEIPWQDRARALAAIHALRVAANPLHTVTATAREIAGKRGSTAGGKMRTIVRNNILLAENLHRPSVAKARNATEAFGILMKEENARVEAIMISRRNEKASAEPAFVTAVNADLLEYLPGMPEGEVDLIIGDLPYGIGADSGGFRSRTVEHHNYDDSFENARKLLQAVVVEGFRVTKPRANLFLFGDVDLFPFFKEAAARMGWKPFRTPVIWQKSESEGLAPWGREGFRRTYEMIFFATKGGKGLWQSPTDILTVKRVSRAKRRYGPEKPIELLRALVECATMPGDLVLDPCCGAGSTLAACRQLKRRAIGIELDASAFNLAVVAADHDMEETEEEPAEALA